MRLAGSARHGLARTDYNILYDPELSFRDIANQFMSMLQKKAQAEKGEDSSNEGDAPKTEVSVKQEPQSEGDKSEQLFDRSFCVCGVIFTLLRHSQVSSCACVWTRAAAQSW